MESISEEGAGESKPKPKESGIKAVVKLPSLVKKKSTEPKPPKPGKRKPESEDSEEIVFAPEVSPTPGDIQDSMDMELKQRDSIV